MPTAILSPSAKQQFFTDGSTVAAGYRLHTYLANSANVPAETYRDRAGTVPNTNPIILDARGEATIYLQPGVVYDYVLKTDQGATVWTREDVTAEAGDANAVTFTQAGVGAVQTDVQTKLRRMEVNAEDFGLAADGATDDTATLERLISFAGANGRRLILPEGTSSAPRIIRINRPLTIPAGMAANWLGGGADKTIIRLSAASLTNDMIAFVGAPKGVHIRGIRFDQSGATTSLAWGSLGFQNAEDIEIAYCEFLNFDRAGLVFNGCRGWSVHHNHFVRAGTATPANSTNQAFLVSESSQAVRDGDFSFNRLEGSAIDVAGANLDIHHNDISGWGFGAGVTIEQTDNTHTNSIRSNRIHNSLVVIDSNGYRPGGIENWGHSTEISFNEIFSSAGAGMDQGGQSCRVVGNICYNNGQYDGSAGIVSRYGDATYNASGSVYIGNKCFDTQGTHTQTTGYADQSIALHSLTFRGNQFNSVGVTPESIISVAPDYQGPSFESGVPLDPGSIASGASASVTMTVPGAQIGDYVTASFTNDLQGCLLTADVTATNTVRIVISNLTGSPKDLAAGTVRAKVQKPMNYTAY